ncbi:hypothetical protein HG536_0G04370 [Torulaspora globosa]|uniref:Suppressor of forked domain-containing protein n=1 Tax=Torulaspora globosa TaxID=48254 RepID=A0A7G3ZM39_9SACH|nr:uncharacterized protein HG536_0G04370 [Torulaspora globosa]QLL34575.1 hypothetical protein HG536_0G04370 [Torulaspora globosa]
MLRSYDAGGRALVVSIYFVLPLSSAISRCLRKIITYKPRRARWQQMTVRESDANELDTSPDSFDALEGLDPSFLKENAELVDAYKNIRWNSVQSLNALVGCIEKTILKYKNPNDAIKRAMESIYRQLLQKYPLLFGYWKRFTAVQYQLYGLEKSIATLKEALESFPNSLELWCDYLNVLCVNSADKVELIRENFLMAKDKIGYHFLSHPFWDRYIEFETKHQEWNSLNSIYAELLCIPLHQYARYGTAYRKFLADHVEFTPHNNLDVEIRKTHGLVTAVWPFESKIKQGFFNVTPVSDEELANWDRYLTYVEENEATKVFPTKFIESVFQRCLVPCLYYEHFWIKYHNWLELAKNSDLLTLIDSYQRGISRLPRSSKQFRYRFLDFLKKNYRKDKELILLSFTQTTAACIKLFPSETFLISEYLVLLKRSRFASSINQDEKEIHGQQILYAKELESAVSSYLNGTVDKGKPLQDMINDVNLPTVVVELIKTTWLTLKNSMQTRKYFNFYGKNRLFRSSTAFWLTYYKFEKSNQNFAKLNRFINDLGTEINLPVTIINDILRDYNSFYLANSNAGMYQTVRSAEEDYNKLYSVDPILLSRFKRNDPLWVPGRSQNTSIADWYRTKQFRENGHPGILSDKPQISNTIVESSTRSQGNRRPPLPSFKNLEKINQQPRYENSELPLSC